METEGPAMKININVKRRFKINGKEYNSIEEMPDDVRAAFEEAMDSQAGAEHTVKSEATKNRIVFNGTELVLPAPLLSLKILLYKNEGVLL